jgi:hypothetical protein
MMLLESKELANDSKHVINRTSIIMGFFIADMVRPDLTDSNDLTEIKFYINKKQYY